MVALISAGDRSAVERAAAVLEEGGTVVLPTDTVYGLAVLPSIATAVDRVFELKQRPEGLHLAVLVAEPGQVGLVSADRRPGVGALMREFWPGPLTLVLGDALELAHGLGENDGTVGVRCPDHDLVRAIAALVGPTAVTSANVHGLATPTHAADVLDQLGGVDLAIDGGECPGGVASTVVDATGPTPALLRQGPISATSIQTIWTS